MNLMVSIYLICLVGFSMILKTPLWTLIIKAVYLDNLSDTKVYIESRMYCIIHHFSRAVFKSDAVTLDLANWPLKPNTFNSSPFVPLHCSFPNHICCLWIMVHVHMKILHFGLAQAWNSLTILIWMSGTLCQKSNNSTSKSAKSMVLLCSYMYTNVPL